MKNLNKEIYSTKELSALLGVTVKTMWNFPWYKDYGTLISQKRFFTKVEVSKMINLHNYHKTLFKRRLVQIIKELQPLRINEVKEAFSERFYKVRFETVNDAIDDITLSDIDPNLWEDDDDKLYYGFEKIRG